MSLNDKDTTLFGARGVDVHPGVANPTMASSHSDPLKSNFVTDPTDDNFGAGAGPTFTGHRDAAKNFSKTAGVVEGRPGIIETTNIDPLNENSNKDDGWANANTGTGTGSQFSSNLSGAASTAMDTAAYAASSAATMATGAARMAYGHATGDPDTMRAGKEQIWGKEQ